MKVAIIGAGISGLNLAAKLAGSGHEVTVFEKKNEIGKKACSGLFSDRILEFIPEAKSLIENEIRSVFIHFPRKTVNVSFSRRFLVMSHAELDRLVAREAAVNGVKIRLQNEIKALPEGFDRVLGCDGPNSAVRGILGLKRPSLRLGVMGFVRQEDYSGSVETWPINKGFIWKIPRGKEVEYGALGEIKEVKSVFEEFLKARGLVLERVESGLVPQGLAIPRNEKVTLCGDAAGLCKSWSGGGVVWGLMAADILLKYFPDFLEYKNKVEKFFLLRIFISKVATFLVYLLGFKFPWLLPKKVRMESDFLF
ncbi:MAG: FAD-dependent oxidoreductase [Candidatus Paceibacterota bacterium]|jgi:flavin-dependent dehydrogenase